MQHFFYPKIDSTNLEARRIIEKSLASPPFWIHTDYQLQGRGQAGNTWESEAGKNFLGSFVFKPGSVPAVSQFMISCLISLGIVDLLELFAEEVTIKWPNDIYIGNHKVAGILIENDIAGDQIDLTIAGIGININQTEFFTDAPNPMSIRQIVGADLLIEEIRMLVEQSIERHLHDLHVENYETVIKQYQDHLYRLKVFAPYKADNKWFEARIVGIGEFGCLILEDKKGVRKNFGFKEVEFILA